MFELFSSPDIHSLTRWIAHISTTRDSQDIAKAQERWKNTQSTRRSATTQKKKKKILTQAVENSQSVVKKATRLTIHSSKASGVEYKKKTPTANSKKQNWKLAQHVCAARNAKLYWALASLAEREKPATADQRTIDEKRIENEGEKNGHCCWVLSVDGNDVIDDRLRVWKERSGERRKSERNNLNNGGDVADFDFFLVHSPLVLVDVLGSSLLPIVDQCGREFVINSSWFSLTIQNSFCFSPLSRSTIDFFFRRSFRGNYESAKMNWVLALCGDSLS